MGVITDILGEVDDAIESVAEAGFLSLAGPLGDVISVGATVTLMARSA